MTIRAVTGTDIVAGSTVVATGRVIVRGGSTNSDSDVASRWELVDDDNIQLLSGEPSNQTTSNVRGGVAVEMTATLDLPDNLPPVAGGYTLMWFVNVNGREAQGSEELLLSDSNIELGMPDAVTIGPRALVFEAFLPADTGTLHAQLYNPAGQLIQDTTAQPTGGGGVGNYRVSYTTDNLWYLANGQSAVLVSDPVFVNELSYMEPGDPTVYGFVPGMSHRLELAASLDPWMVVYSDANDSPLGTAQGWVINTHIASAMHEMQKSMERVMRYPGLLASAFDNADYVQFLKMGRDLFNGTGKPTNFSMIGANGPIRRMWLICAQYEAAMSRQLEEAVKAFDFSGQSTSLTVDISPAYETYKSDMQGQLESLIVPFKKQLAIKGILDGDGGANVSGGSAPISLGTTQSSVGNGAYYGGGGDGEWGSHLTLYRPGKV